MYVLDDDEVQKMEKEIRSHPYQSVPYDEEHDVNIYKLIQSERDKVLSLIQCFIEHEGFNCGETDAIKEYMEELRQQVGEP
jgi:hypothetical protein